jgi:hypothetical protein
MSHSRKIYANKPIYKKTDRGMSPLVNTFSLMSCTRINSTQGISNKPIYCNKD